VGSDSRHASEVRARRMLSGRIRGGGSPAGRVVANQRDGSTTEDASRYRCEIRRVRGVAGHHRGKRYRAGPRCLLRRNVHVFGVPQRGPHARHSIPESQGEVEAGLRRLNWVWYVHVDPADLPKLLTDSSGRRHRTSLPRRHGSRGLRIGNGGAGRARNPSKNGPRWSRKRPTDCAADRTCDEADPVRSGLRGFAVLMSCAQPPHWPLVFALEESKPPSDDEHPCRTNSSPARYSDRQGFYEFPALRPRASWRRRVLARAPSPAPAQRMRTPSFRMPSTSSTLRPSQKSPI
jgi:hypothetical protein